MSDIVDVTLQILSEHTDAVDCFLENEFRESSEHGGFKFYYFDCISNGDLDFLPELEESGIAYNSSWEEGDYITSGTRSCRFTSEGKKVIKNIDDYELHINMDELIVHIDNPDKLIAFIKEEYASVQHLPWDKQVKYGKLYRVNQLIGV